LFLAYGVVETVTLVRDRDTGNPRGFAFVEMSNDEEAEKAITAVNGLQVAGRALSVTEARPKTVGSGAKSANGSIDVIVFRCHRLQAETHRRLQAWQGGDDRRLGALNLGRPCDRDHRFPSPIPTEHTGLEPGINGFGRYWVVRECLHKTAAQCKLPLRADLGFLGKPCSFLRSI
jgi:RNA recognition motif-containing protein